MRLLLRTILTSVLLQGGLLLLYFLNLYRVRLSDHVDRYPYSSYEDIIKLYPSQTGEAFIVPLLLVGMFIPSFIASYFFYKRTALLGSQKWLAVMILFSSLSILFLVISLMARQGIVQDLINIGL